ncbi:hypothetical protein BGW38_003633 [Lunasporangiospora selenospora]|uniref:pH-response regulator protein palC n=1 Tax=Lunasporangiospora selenospora TaxID=979761 RepID=A0A9P6FR81_9FUNG|nr:hypothetical protein BGW38_003633 [Lunasporangiospora selenospora]
MLTLGYVLMDRANEYAHSTQRKILIAIGDLSAYAAGDGSSIVGSSSPMTATASVASSASGLGSGISGPKSSKPSAASRLFKKSSSTSGSSSSKGSKSNSNTIGEFTDYLTDEDLARIDQQLTMAADLYCRAAGVFEYIAQELIPRWNSSLVVLPKATDGSDVAAAPGGKVQSESSRPVDVQSCFVSAQIRLALAEAHACTVRKASIKAARASAVRQASSTTGTSPGSSGSGTGSKASYVLLAKISIGVKEEYERAYGLLKSVKDLNEISTDFRNHVKDGKLYYEALAQTLLGMDAYESQQVQYGKAIGFMSVARASFATLTKSKSSFHTIAQVASFEYRLASERCLAFEKINDSVTFEKVPTPTELLAVMPSGRDLLAVKKYQVPRPAFGVPVSGNGSGLGAAGEDDVNQIAYALQGAYF